MPETLHVLSYDYVPDIMRRRAPHRDAHLAALRRLADEGLLVSAGATGDPPTGALIVFRTAEAAETFLAEDPYVAAGLVRSHRLAPWTVVVP
jgi:uncharacterized protein YciI